MKRKRYWEIGGFLAGAVLILFGVAAVFMGVNGYNTTRDAIKAEGITFGPASDPAVAKYADQWAGEQVTTGDQARAFAKVMRMHTLEATGGLTYAAMGRYQSSAKPDRSRGHERRDGSGQGRERTAGRQRRPEHLGDRDRTHDGPERELHGRATVGLRARRRDRAAADGHRARDPRLRGLRSRARAGIERGACLGSRPRWVDPETNDGRHPDRTDAPPPGAQRGRLRPPSLFP